MRSICGFILIILCCSFIRVRGQPEKDPYIALSFGLGSPVNNYVNFPEIKEPTTVVELSVGQNLNGDKTWHSSFNHPHQGFSFLYSSLGNDDVLGNMYALTYDFDSDIVLSSNSCVRFGISYGVAALDKPYSETDNPGNIINGSKFTAIAKARVHLERQIADNYSVFGGASFFHTSNSHTQLPNVGMNTPYFSAGIRYGASRKRENVLTDQRNLRNDKLRFGIRASYAFNEHGGTLGAVGGPKYPIYVLSAFAAKNFRYTRRWTLGFDVWYNCGVKSFINSQDYYERLHDLRSTVVSVMAGHEFLFGNMAFVFQGGVYLYNPFYKKRWRESNERELHQALKTWFPGRVGGYYYFRSPITDERNNFFFGVFIKTNLGQADFLESTIGVQF